MKLRIIDWEKVEKKFRYELNEMHQRESEYFTRTSTQGVKLRGTISGWTWMYGIVEDALVTDKTFDVPSEPPPKPEVHNDWAPTFSVKDGKIFGNCWMGSGMVPFTLEQTVELLNISGREIRKLKEGK